ncbi:MAG: GtrA family protein [Bacilli bacterium]|nr:GtrA family protein [Bacilli bacterium]
MNNLINKIKLLLNNTKIRFLIVGCLNTIVGYSIYAILIYLNINYLIANTISTIIGIIHSYIWNRLFTFKSNNNIKKEILKFISVYFISYVLGLLNLYILVNILNTNKYIAGIINIFITTIISWFGHRYFSFRR